MRRALLITLMVVLTAVAIPSIAAAEPEGYESRGGGSHPIEVGGNGIDVDTPDVGIPDIGEGSAAENTDSRCSCSVSVGSTGAQASGTAVQGNRGNTKAGNLAGAAFASAITDGPGDAGAVGGDGDLTDR